MGLAGMIWEAGREQGAAGSCRDRGTPNPQPPPPRERALNTGLLAAVLRPDLAPGPRGSRQCPAGRGLPFISFMSTLPAQEGGEEPGWSSSNCFGPPPPASGRQQGRHCSFWCHAASESCCRSPARAAPGQSGAWCRAGAERARRCRGEKMGTAAQNHPTGTGGPGTWPRAPLTPQDYRTVG